MRRHSTFFIAPALAAALAPVAAAAQTAPTPAWLVGAWAPRDAYCASGDPISFAANGTYASGLDSEGRWTLAGNVLTFAYRDMEDGEPRGPLKRTTSRLTRLGADRMLMDRDELRRCNPRGGAEPWHPGETFDTGR